MTVYRSGATQHTIAGDGNTTFNVTQQGGTRDFIVHGDVIAGLFTVDVSADRIGIATTTPTETFSVHGSLFASGTSTLNATRFASSTIMAPNLAAAEVTSDILCWDTVQGKITHQAANCTVSSQRFKHDITDLKLDSDKITDLKARSFKYNANNEESFGLIAEEVAEVYPELVVYTKEGEIQSVKYDMLSVLLLDYIQKHDSSMPIRESGFNPAWLGLLGLLGIIPLFKKHAPQPA